MSAMMHKISSETHHNFRETLGFKEIKSEGKKMSEERREDDKRNDTRRAGKTFQWAISDPCTIVYKTPH